jgi:hypothetical protein
MTLSVKQPVTNVLKVQSAIGTSFFINDLCIEVYWEENMLNYMPQMSYPSELKIYACFAIVNKRYVALKEA